VGAWTWSGIGVPAEILPDIEARVASVITEHLVTRYGVAERLEFAPEGDPGPF